MNPLLAAIPPSLIRAMNARKRPGDIDLGLGEPTLAPPLAPFEAATAWVRANGCPYSPNAGFTELREAIARRHGQPGGAERVCVTVGSQEALYLALKATLDSARDEVLIVEPAYPLYPKLCALEGIRHRVAALRPETGFAPDAGPVLAALGPDTRMVILGSPGNPTGRVWDPASLAALAAGLEAHGRRHGPVWVLLDEVYQALRYPSLGEAPLPLSALHPHTLVVNSLSKSHALTGLRLGWLLAPLEIAAAAVKVHQFVATAASTFSQRVALAAFEDPDPSPHLPAYARRREALLEGLARHGLRHVPPEGGFYCMVALEGALAADSIAAATRLLEERRVVTVPGRAFGASAEGWLRLSWGGDEAQVAEGLARLAAFMREA